MRVKNGEKWGVFRGGKSRKTGGKVLEEQKEKKKFCEK